MELLVLFVCVCMCVCLFARVFCFAVVIVKNINKLIEIAVKVVFCYSKQSKILTCMLC